MNKFKLNEGITIIPSTNTHCLISKITGERLLEISISDVESWFNDLLSNSVPLVQ